MSKNKSSEPVNYDSMKCIWMSSNTVEYKLCDKNFDCDNCVFDRIMRNINPGNSASDSCESSNFQSNIIRRKLDLLKAIHYSPGYHYMGRSIILKKLFDKTYYLGLDKTAYLFLDNLKEYEFQTAGSGITRGKGLLKLWGEWGETEIVSPINFLIVDKLKHSIADFKVSSWLSLVDADPDEIRQVELTEDEYNQNLTDLSTRLLELENEFNFLGARLNDGGLKVMTLYEATGIEKYKEFLNLLFA
ncbi:MAG TPA: hypothetical protein VKD08_14130 [Ignavibacteriaceae bacterium]|nr:hypothetical protein [Ignavibacteriaceae bacterium]